MKFLDLGAKPALSHAPPVNRCQKNPFLQEVQIGSSREPNCSSCSPDHFDIPVHGSTMKIVDARAIIEVALDPRDARF